MNEKLRIWLEAARPRTLPASIAPVVVGAAIGFAEAGWRPLVLAAVLAAALAIQIATNFVNDWGDFQRGADTPDRVGPRRAVAAGLIPARTMFSAAMVLFAVAAVIGLGLIGVGGWPILWIGVASILSGLAYTAGPMPLAYVGLGDLFVFAFFGPVAVLGTEWLMIDRTTEAGWLASLALGALATAILVVNNIRDVEGDARAGKRTLVVRFGRPIGRGFYVLLLLVALLVPLLLVVLDLAGPPVLLAWLAAPLARAPLQAVFLPNAGAALNEALGATARLHLAFGALLAVGFLL